jgi:hypothetical protein
MRLSHFTELLHEAGYGDSVSRVDNHTGESVDSDKEPSNQHEQEATDGGDDE